MTTPTPATGLSSHGTQQTTGSKHHQRLPGTHTPRTITTMKLLTIATLTGITLAVATSTTTTISVTSPPETTLTSTATHQQ